jgi:hypothetical protein
LFTLLAIAVDWTGSLTERLKFHSRQFFVFFFGPESVAVSKLGGVFAYSIVQHRSTDNIGPTWVYSILCWLSLLNLFTKFLRSITAMNLVVVAEWNGGNKNVIFSIFKLISITLEV